MSKVCSRCKNEKALSEFYARKLNTAKGLKSYVQSRCKECNNEAKKRWRKANRERRNQRKRERYARKKAGIRRKPRQTHAERMAVRKNRYHNDANFKLICNLRSRLRAALKGNIKSGRTLELLGTTVEHLHEHLESQFLPGMTWDNHGQGEGKWQIDHIVPCASFNLSEEEQQRQCCHWIYICLYIWWKDNQEKSDKVPENRVWVDTCWVDT